MSEKRRKKIEKLLALANDANDEESMTALAKAQELMLEYKIDEQDIFQYKQQQRKEIVVNNVIYSGKPHKWVYNLARIIAKNFRVRFYYSTDKVTDLHFVGLASDIQIAEITFQYARGSIGYSSKQFMQKSEIRRKRKRKWQMKQDYIQGYLNALYAVFKQQVLTNGYEVALQVPIVVEQEMTNLNLVSGKDTSHDIKNYEAYHSGYQEGLKFKQKNLIN